MTSGQALEWVAHAISCSGIEDSYLEARVLLGHILKLSSAELYTYPERILTQAQVDDLQNLVKRRLCREPIAYIIEHKEFYGLDFCVDCRVLIPRPETELLVEESVKFIRSRADYPFSLTKPFVIADIGTGCGAIAISLALNFPETKFYATDISPLTLEVARLNCEYHSLTKRIILLQGNLLEPISEPVDLIVANLPYIRSSELPNLSPEITNFEPRVALDGGQNGLEQIHRILEQVEEKIWPQGCLLLEIGQEQEKAIGSLINHSLSEVVFEIVPDLNGIGRVVKITF